MTCAALEMSHKLCSAGVHPELPWIMLLPGANCYSQDYSFLTQQLAGRGYLVAVADELHPASTSDPFISRKSSLRCQASVKLYCMECLFLCHVSQIVRPEGLSTR